MKKIFLSMLALLGVSGIASAADTGSAGAPLSVSDFLAQGTPAEAVADTYVQGYIVGWIDGMTLKTGCKFTLPATSATNLLLAGSSSETDYNYCIPVQLPSGSVRNALNLLDHPENFGHEVVLCGSHEKYFGANGLKGITKYEWVGDAPVQETPSYGPEVTGTAENPLDVDAFKAAATAGTSIPNTYLKAFIVGYVPGKSLDEAVVGSATGEDVSETNILVAGTASPASLDDCVPVQLPFGDVRTALNLKANPGNLGKEVTLLGTHTNYFGVTGLKEVTAYAFGSEVIVPPTPAEDGVFVSLVNNADGWTFDDVTLSEGITYVWKWDSNYKNLTGSAYANKAAHAAESYAISPVVDLTNVETPTVSFEHAARFQTTLRDLCRFCIREKGASEWTELTIATWPEAGGWDFVNCGEISLADYVGKQVEFGFKYASTADGADTWEIKNLKVDGKTGVEMVLLGNDVRVEGRNIVAPAGAEVYSVNGVKAGMENVAPGLYIVVSGRQAVKVFVR